MTTGVRWPSVWSGPRGRGDYAATVRDRGVREDGLLPLSPARSKDSTDVKTTVIEWSVSTTRTTLLTPTTGKKIRIVHYNLIQRPTTNTVKAYLELYFGTGTNITTTPSNAIAWEFSNNVTGDTASRSYTRGQGPLGAKDAVISIRIDSTLNGGTYVCLLEYTEEK